ncbi:MAG: component of SufBCD complex [Pseudomonadota bacterium]
MEGFYEEVIGSRSFASIWYWIVYALLWTRATHWTLGVPYEDARNAIVHGDQHMIDFETQMEINTRKRMAVFNAYPVIAVGAIAFLLATVFMLGFSFGIQFMQASFLLAFPLTIVTVLSLRLATVVDAKGLRGSDLYRAYVWHRRTKQAIGGVSIFCSAFWGVSQTLFSPYA